MPSKRILPTAAIIAAYKSSPQPYADPLRNLAALAVQLKNLKDDAWYLTEEICEHYVYVYLDPRRPGKFKYKCPSGKVVRFDHQPFYVGKGFGDRLDAHLKEAAQKRGIAGKHGHKLNTIWAIQDAGFDLEEYRWITRSKRSDWMAQALEIDLIAGIGRRNTQAGPLTNLTDGGEGVTGAKTPKTAAHRAAIGRANMGRVCSEETRSRIGQANRGRKRTPEVVERIRQLGIGRKNTKETLARMSEAAKNRTFRVVRCTHCGLTGKVNAMRRWHFDNCKQRST